MKVTYLQNAAHSGPGNILTWGEERGIEISHTLLFAGEPLPSTYPDLLIVLGGVPAECDAWLQQEITYIRGAIDAGSRVLGLCLGSQLIVEALGGSLVPHTHSECGWWPVALNDKATEHPVLKGLTDTSFFFFHRNTVVMPSGMSLLASNAGCKHQIFAAGDRVVGIQGHPEMSADKIEFLIRNKKAYVEAGEFVRITDRCHSETTKLADAQHFLWTVLDNMRMLPNN